MDVHEIAEAFWSDTRAQKAAAALAREYLDTLPAGQETSSSALLRALGVPADDIKGFLNKLSGARSSGLLEGYWHSGPKRSGTFGKPSVIWHASEDTLDEDDEPLEGTPESRAAKMQAIDEYVTLRKSRVAQGLPIPPETWETDYDRYMELERLTNG